MVFQRQDFSLFLLLTKGSLKDANDEYSSIITVFRQITVNLILVPHVPFQKQTT